MKSDPTTAELARAEVQRAEAVYRSVSARPWYRILGYRSATPLVILAVGFVLLFIPGPHRASQLNDIRAWVVSVLLLAFVGLALWEWIDWRAERRAAHSSLEMARGNVTDDRPD